MAKRRLEPFEISPTQLHKALGVSVPAISRLEQNSKRYRLYRDAYLYRLILSGLKSEQIDLFDANNEEPTVIKLVAFFKLSKQNFYSLKKSNFDLYNLYVDAWKYQNIILNRILDKRCVVGNSL